jgi:hypothetical protein
LVVCRTDTEWRGYVTAVIVVLGTDRNVRGM